MSAKAKSAHRHAPEWVILTIACIAQFMVVLDVSIVNVALPSMQRDLHFSLSSAQWVVNAYVLTFAGFLLLGGRAADIFGRRRVYLTGLFIFVIASIGAGFAATGTQIVAVRALQGLGMHKPVEGPLLLCGGVEMHVIEQDSGPAFVEFGRLCQGGVEPAGARTLATQSLAGRLQEMGFSATAGTP